MDMTHCPHCHEPLERPIARPRGCVCDATEWAGVTTIPPVCRRYEPNDDADPVCVRCEHDRECHQ